MDLRLPLLLFGLIQLTSVALASTSTPGEFTGVIFIKSLAIHKKENSKSLLLGLRSFVGLG